MRFWAAHYSRSRDEPVLGVSDMVEKRRSYSDATGA